MVFRADGKNGPTKAMNHVSDFQHWFNKHSTRLTKAWVKSKGELTEEVHNQFMEDCKIQHIAFVRDSTPTKSNDVDPQDGDCKNCDGKGCEHCDAREIKEHGENDSKKE